MQGIGDRLRDARIRQEIDIRDVESATKIRAKYLRAMENEEFGLLPGATFVKTFLRTYAQYLGLDAHLLVQEYRTQYEAGPAADLQPYTSPQRERSLRMGGGGGGRPRIGVLVGLALVALLGLLFVLGRLPEGPAGSGGTQRAQPDPVTGAQRPAAPEEGSRRRRRPPTRTVSLRVAPVESTYVCVLDGDGEQLFEGTIAEPRTFRGRRLRVNLGRRSARLRMNGRRVAVDPGSNPVGFELRPRSPPRPLTGAQRPSCA